MNKIIRKVLTGLAASRFSYSLYKNNYLKAAGIVHKYPNILVEEEPALYSVLGNGKGKEMIENINKIDNKGQVYNESIGDHIPLLAFAVVNGMKEETKLMLEGGGDIHMRVSGGNNLVHMLVLGSKKPNTENHQTTNLAISTFEEMLKLLVSYGADVNAQNGEGQTPLHLACILDDQTKIKSLLNMKANTQIYSNKSTLPIHESALYGSLSSFLLLQAKTPSNLQKGIFHLSLVNENTDIAYHLLSAQDKNNLVKQLYPQEPKVIPLFFAMQNSGFEIIDKMILMYPESVGIVDLIGNTPLHAACQYKNIEAVRSLLRHSANPKQPNQFGVTPREVAKATGYGAIIDMLDKQH